MSNSNKNGSTHSIVFQIKSQEIKRNAALVQESVVNHDPDLSGYITNPNSFHVTLSMLKIEDEEGTRQVIQCLDEVSHLIPKPNGFVVKVRGVDTFGHLVLYAQVFPEPQDAFLLAKVLLEERLSSYSKVQVTDMFDFRPHMTLVKVGVPGAEASPHKHISQESYSSHLNDQFGEQRFDNLQLCVLDGETREPDGFYNTIHQIHF